MTSFLFTQALKYSGIVGAVTLEALKGTNPVWALPTPLVLGCLDAWVRLGLLHETTEPNQASLERAQSPQLTVSVVTRIFDLAVKAMQSESAGEPATLVSTACTVFPWSSCTLPAHSNQKVPHMSWREWSDMMCCLFRCRNQHERWYSCSRHGGACP